MNKESEKDQEGLDSELKSLEEAEILEFLKEINFNPERPTYGTYFTPMEHHLIGSTGPGKAFHPNLPIAKMGGTSIEKINALREATNKEGTFFFSFKAPKGEYINIYVDLLPLDEETTNSQESVVTFQIRQPTENYEQYLDDFRQRMAEVQQEARQRLNKEFMNNPEQENPIESTIDFEWYEKSLKDGTADKYFENVGVLLAETLLEEQGDERVWPELTKEEQEKISELLEAYAKEKNLQVIRDEQSCMVKPKYN